MKRLVLSFCLIGLAIPAGAQEAGAGKKLAIADTRALADQAMKLVQQEKLVEAYAVVKAFWPAPAVEIDGLANQTNTQWPMIQQRFGKSTSTEFIEESKVGESFIRYTYLQKFERHAIRWTFVFYKPVSHWLVNSVAWDDGVHELFD